jgi:hypothetical protein
MTTMTSRERSDLAQVVRLRMRVAKSAVDARAAELRADVEKQLSAIYDKRDILWREITSKADDAVKAADAEIAAICAERGIAERLRPSLKLSWWGRGENADKTRRVELHEAACRQIDADRKAGHQRVDAWGAELQTSLIAGSLTSDDAKNFLAAMPTAEALLPPVTIRAELVDGEAR